MIDIQDFFLLVGAVCVGLLIFVLIVAALGFWIYRRQRNTINKSLQLAKATQAFTETGGVLVALALFVLVFKGLRRMCGYR